MAPIRVLGLTEEKSDAHQRSATLGLGEASSDRLEPAMYKVSLNASAHVPKNLLADDSGAEALVQSTSFMQRTRGTATRFEDKKPDIPLLHPQALGIESSDDHFVVDDASGTEDSGSSSDWDTRRKPAGSVVKRLGTDRKQVQRVMSIGEVSGLAKSCVGSVESAFCVEKNAKAGGVELDDNEVIQPLLLNIPQHGSRIETVVTNHNSPYPQLSGLESTSSANSFLEEPRISIVNRPVSLPVAPIQSKSFSSLQQITGTVASPDSPPKPVGSALEYHKPLITGIYSFQRRPMSCNVFEDARDVINEYDAERVSIIPPPFHTTYKGYCQNHSIQCRLGDGLEVPGDVHGREKPMSLRSGELPSPIQQLTDVNNSTPTPPRKPSHSQSKLNQAPKPTSPPSRSFIERHAIAQSQPVLKTHRCHPFRSSSFNGEPQPSTPSKVSSLPPYNPNKSLSGDSLSSKASCHQPYLVVPKLIAGCSENSIEFRNLTNFDLPPPPQQQPSAQCNINGVTTTGVSEIPFRAHKHSKLAVALARDTRQPSESSKASVSTLTFLRHHDHPKLRNTQKQRAIKARARYEAKAFTQTTKAQDLILVARQKLEDDRHQAFINSLFSELDEIDSFTMRYPMFKSRMLYAGLVLIVMGVVGLYGTSDRALTLRRQGFQLIGSELALLLVSFVIVLICGIMWVGAALYTHGAFTWLRDGDPLGLREVTSWRRRGARAAYRDLEAGIRLSSTNGNIAPTITRPAPSRTRQSIRGIFNKNVFSHSAPASGTARTQDIREIEMDNLDRQGRVY